MKPDLQKPKRIQHDTTVYNCSYTNPHQFAVTHSLLLRHMEEFLEILWWTKLGVVERAGPNTAAVELLTNVKKSILNQSNPKWPYFSDLVKCKWHRRYPAPRTSKHEAVAIQHKFHQVVPALQRQLQHLAGTWIDRTGTIHLKYTCECCTKKCCSKFTRLIHDTRWQRTALTDTQWH